MASSSASQLPAQPQPPPPVPTLQLRPQNNPSDSGSIGNMLAIVLKEDVTIAASNGSLCIPSGTMGYLIENSRDNPANVRVQLVLPGKHGTSESRYR
ncbi:hypothetical protein CcaCcLH18_08580 [Colletotrichum camelliae]|nr:hypothetical protein CcaCcLH18_08580 [Colletotrichum camelliae]